jgi:lipopolysaccharide transport system permease protein
MFSTLYHYRWFIWGSVKREFQTRYHSSMIGAAWLVLQPLAMILVYTLVFSQVMRSRLSGLENNAFGYSIYLCTGILTWGFFADIVNRGQMLFIDNANLLKKLKFPKICLPATLVLSTTLDFVLIFSLFILFLLFSNNFPGWPFLAFFPILLIQILFAMGLAMTLGVLNVFFRDIKQLMSILLQFWFWFTPVVYPMSALPVWVKPWLELNPMVGLIQAYQKIFVESALPNWNTLWPIFICAIFFCCSGIYLFRRHSADMVDEL